MGGKQVNPALNEGELIGLQVEDVAYFQLIGIVAYFSPEVLSIPFAVDRLQFMHFYFQVALEFMQELKTKYYDRDKIKNFISKSSVKEFDLN